MYHLIGTNTDGTDYRVPARNMGHFATALQAIEADPSRELPNMVTGTLSPERLPLLIKQYLAEHDAVYEQDPEYQGRHINLYIREDDQMPSGMGGMVSRVGSKTIIRLNGNADRYEQLASYLHEMTHIWRDDFLRDQKEDIAEIEAENERDLVEAAKLILAEYEAKYGD